MASAAEVSGGLVLSTWHPLCGVQFYSCILAFPSLPRAEPVPPHAALTWTVQSPEPLWERDTCDPAWASEIGSDKRSSLMWFSLVFWVLRWGIVLIEGLM